MGDLGKGWNNFVKSGQIWALMIGVVVGYLFRSITNT
jgi:large-conductance mechanosensitive channel